MATCFFVSDLHGSPARYSALFEAISRDVPDVVFLGGDLLPSGRNLSDASGFIERVLVSGFGTLRAALQDRYPTVFLLLGNDDPRILEARIIAGSELWTYIHQRRSAIAGHPVYGYSSVPPTPFRLKDWERYDVARFVDPGCISPEEGFRTVNVEENEARYGTIEKDLVQLTGDDSLTDAIVLFHSPPYRTALDRAALEGKSVDHAPLDVNVGSIAIRRLIEDRQPLVTLHGHIHESARLTGSWRDRIGRTHLLGGAHDGPELALVRFDPGSPEEATRELVAGS